MRDADGAVPVCVWVSDSEGDNTVRMRGVLGSSCHCKPATWPRIPQICVPRKAAVAPHAYDGAPFDRYSQLG